MKINETIDYVVELRNKTVGKKRKTNCYENQI